MEEIDVQELWDRIFDLQTQKYEIEDKLDEIREYLIHSSISIEDMYKVGGMFE